MKIVRETVDIEYYELEVGDVFTYEQGVYIKTANGYALRLDTGYYLTEGFDDEDYVRRVSAELKIS